MTGPVIPTHDRRINPGFRFPFERVPKIAAAEVENGIHGDRRNAHPYILATLPLNRGYLIRFP
jgi:hypothetical protein